MRTSKRKTISYKKASFSNKSSHTLQELLQKALSLNKKVGQRKEPLLDNDPDSEIYRLINCSRSQLGMVFGNLILYTKGQNIPLITLDEDADEYEVEQIVPTENKGKKREFLNSILYFAIKENHVVLLQSLSLKARDFENYLNWFLSKVSILPENNRLNLNDQPPSATREKISKSHVKSVSLGLPLLSQSEGVGTKHREHHYVPIGKGFDVIRAALGEDGFRRLKLKDSLNDSNITVGLEISYARKTDSNAQKLLDDLAISMRHAEKEDVTIHLEGGGTITGDEIKITGFMSVLTISGHVALPDLFQKMKEWLEEKIKQELVFL